jgi:hypothetical protein
MSLGAGSAVTIVCLILIDTLDQGRVPVKSCLLQGGGLTRPPRLFRRLVQSYRHTNLRSSLGLTVAV